MKKQTLTFFAMASLFVMLAVGSAYADADRTRVRADIPFDFIVGNATLPAGTYTFKRRDTNAGVLVIQSRDHRESAFAITNTVQCNPQQIEDESKLIFNRYGDLYFFTQVWAGGSISGRELPKTRQEREHMAQSGWELEVVSIAAAL